MYLKPQHVRPGLRLEDLATESKSNRFCPEAVHEEKNIPWGHLPRRWLADDSKSACKIVWDHLSNCCNRNVLKICIWAQECNASNEWLSLNVQCGMCVCPTDCSSSWAPAWEDPNTTCYLGWWSLWFVVIKVKLWFDLLYYIATTIQPCRFCCACSLAITCQQTTFSMKEYTGVYGCSDVASNVPAVVINGNFLLLYPKK